MVENRNLALTRMIQILVSTDVNQKLVGSNPGRLMNFQHFCFRNYLAEFAYAD